MDGQNTSLRRSLARDRKSKTIRDTFGASGASTVAHGSLQGGASLGAGSRLLPSRYDSRVVKGLWKEKNKKKRRQMRKSGKSNLCPEPPFEYAEAKRPHQSHCESKILETLFDPKQNPTQPPKGSLLLNINWQNSDGKSKEPCPACERLLCHAQEKCKVTILLCQEDPEDPPEKLSC